ncbi:hypothetical protein PG999_004024 [Apiospora kogelbergensis]|uniref:Uncharacterized protein n=1 Tax=Apiospora kogelbergensis TaxID=1337665 RepID=A0AAW0R5G0_9PEZI
MRVSPTSPHKAKASKKHLGIKGIANNVVSNNIAGLTSGRRYINKAAYALASVVLTTLLGSAAAAPVALANVPDEPLSLYRDILSKRDPPKALAELATYLEKIGNRPRTSIWMAATTRPPSAPTTSRPKGRLNGYTGGGVDCHDESNLDNSNVYVRTRCNNGWCAYVYDYYFEKDTAVEHVADVGGHRHN